MKTNLRLLSMSILTIGLLTFVSAFSSAPNGLTLASKDPLAEKEEANPTPAKEEVKPSQADNTNTSDGTVKIDSYKLLKDDGNGQAGDEVQSFTVADQKQYFDVQLTDFLKTGSVVKWVFTAVDTSGGKNITITEVNTKVFVANRLTANLSLGTDFPVGKYKADITVDGKPLGTIEYLVTEK